MSKRVHQISRFAVGLLLFAVPALSYASPAISHEADATSVAYTDSLSEASSGKSTGVNAEKDKRMESLFPSHSRDLRTSHFTWGAELGSSIDMGGHDMSTFDLDFILGYKNSFIRTVGVGAGVHKAFGNGSTFIPVYLLFRSSFTSKPSLFFLHFKAGYSFNTIQDSDMFGDVVASIGLGINLAMTKKCMTHIIVGYGFRHFTKKHQESVSLGTQNINLAQLSFGISF